MQNAKAVDPNIGGLSIERGKTKKWGQNRLSPYSHVLLANHICWQYLNLPFKHLQLLFLPQILINSMSTNRLTTRPKNAVQHPGLLIPKQTRRSSTEVAAIREAKEKAKKEKELTKTAGIKRVAAFEKNQADNDAMEQTPRVVTTQKPKPLVRTRSYADVLRGDDVDMVEGQSAEPDSAFEVANIEDSQMTESDGMETAVEQAPPRKKMKVNKKDRKGTAPAVRDSIKAVQDMPGKKSKQKKNTEARDSDSMEIDATPKPTKNLRITRRAPNESEEDLPAAPPKQRVVQPTMTEEEGTADLPSKTKGMEKNKGKAKEKPAGKSKATNNGADQIRGRNVPKSVISHLIRIHHPVTCLY